MPPGSPHAAAFGLEGAFCAEGRRLASWRSGPQARPAAGGLNVRIVRAGDGPPGPDSRGPALPGHTKKAGRAWAASASAWVPRRPRTRRRRAGPQTGSASGCTAPLAGCAAERCSVDLRVGRRPAWAGRLLGMCMPFRRPRVWAGGKPAISMRACAGVVHAFGSRRLGYPVTTFARPVQAGPEAGPGGSGKGPLLASWLSTTGNKISSTGSWILGASTFFFLYNICKTRKYGERVTRNDPWGLRRLAGVGHLVPAPAAQRHQDPADPVRAARVRPALPAHPDRPHPQARPTREHLAFCVSIVAVMRLRFAIRRGQPGACMAPPCQERGAGTSLRVKPSCSWERTKALR
jgi:hypothetical protein